MLHDRHRQWIEARGISADLAVKLGLETADLHGGKWLSVPYVEHGKTINHKYRLTSEKRHEMDAGAPLALWNHDCLLEESSRPVVICEGEWDAMVAVQMGWRAVSVPNGAPKTSDDDPANAKRYEFLWRARDTLNKVERFILATDDDGPGRALRADLVTLLGADRCSFVEYPFPTKDLNEILMEMGPEAVAAALNGAKPYPVKGLYKFGDFPPKPVRAHWSTGLPMLDPYIRMVPGTLTVFTGYANIGKSTLLTAIIASQIENHIPVCVASFETDVDILRDGLRQSILRCSSHEMRQRNLTEVDELIEENSTIIYQAVDADDEMDLEWFLDRCRIAVLQHGAKVIFLDPWNELEHKMRRDENETAYTNRALREFRRFAERYQVVFWVVAHPAKPEKGFTGVPKLYQISGSAAWANKPHYGLSYHRKDPSANIGELHVSKVRQGMPGQKTDSDGVKVTLDFRTWEFKDAIA